MVGRSVKPAAAPTRLTLPEQAAVLPVTRTASVPSAPRPRFRWAASGSLTPTIGAEFKNNSGTTVSSLAISYNCEEWRLGALNRFDRMDFQYSTDATSLTTGTWVDADSLDCVTTNTSGTAAGARDGNGATYRTVVSYNVTGLSIASGATFWDSLEPLPDASGADDGLAIDDFQVTAQNATAVTLRTLTARAPPTPSAALAGRPAPDTLAGGAFVWRRREARHAGPAPRVTLRVRPADALVRSDSHAARGAACLLGSV